MKLPDEISTQDALVIPTMLCRRCQTTFIMSTVSENGDALMMKLKHRKNDCELSGQITASRVVTLSQLIKATK
jgi:hypothetical protein